MSLLKYEFGGKYSVDWGNVIIIVVILMALVILAMFWYPLFHYSLSYWFG